MDQSWWMWVAIAAVVLIVVIVIIVVATRGKGEARNREKAAELRQRAAQDEELLNSRQERTRHLEAEAEAARQRAMTESDRADALRAQAGASDERAARAADKAEILDDEATHSRESLDEVLKERDEALREADRRDPDVHTDRHGNRLPDDTTDQGSSDDGMVVPASERLDVGDDYSGDEFDDPDAEYIDPAEHDRLTHERPRHDGDHYDGETSPFDDDSAGDGATAVTLPADHGRPAEQDRANDEALQDGPPSVDPYGNPVLVTDPYGNPVEIDGGQAQHAHDDDVPRDDQGRRLDPYGNPVPDDNR